MPGTGIAHSSRQENQNLSLAERIRFGQQLVVERTKKRPPTWEALEKRFDVPARTLRRLHHQYVVASEAHEDMTGQKVLAESLLMYEQIIDHMSEVTVKARTAPGAVGAARTLMDALAERIELLTRMGRIPRSYRAIDELAVMARVIKRFGEMLEEHEVPAEVVSQFVGLVNEINPVIEGYAGRAVAALPQAS